MRKYRCGCCGWESSSFGSKKTINNTKINSAQEELQQHLKASPECGWIVIMRADVYPVDPAIIRQNPPGLLLRAKKIELVFE